MEVDVVDTTTITITITMATREEEVSTPTINKVTIRSELFLGPRPNIQIFLRLGEDSNCPNSIIDLRFQIMN